MIGTSSYELYLNIIGTQLSVALSHQSLLKPLLTNVKVRFKVFSVQLRSLHGFT
jgi:hypothetical protein